MKFERIDFKLTCNPFPWLYWEWLGDSVFFLSFYLLFMKLTIVWYD